MKLKRRWDESKKRVVGIEVLHAGERQHFSPRILDQAVAQGWATVGKGRVVIHDSASGEDVAYKIERPPGYYCCHCESPLDDGKSAKAHLASAHAGKDSPDPGNPAGYRRDNYFACVRETEV